jgi:uncharacterized protein
MRPFASHQPLTDAEFERLGEFFRETKNRGAMNLEEMDGFFAALICGPESVLPSEYMPYVFGGERSTEGAFKTIDEAKEILGLIMRHWNTIASTLYQGQVYLPFLFECEDGLAHGNDWAKGFLRGMSLRRESWSALLEDEQHGGSLVPVLMLAHEHDPDPKLRPDSISPKQRDSLLTHLAAGLVQICRYFEPHRRGHAGA